MDKKKLLLPILFSLALFSCNAKITTKSEKQPNPPYHPEKIVDSEDVIKYMDGASINDQTLVDMALADINETNVIYASPDGDGDGSYDNPYDLYTALENVVAGETLYLRGGEYIAEDSDGFSISNSGNEDNYITISAYPNESVIITNPNNSSEAVGLVIDSGVSHVIIDSLEIKDINAYCAYGIVTWGNVNHIVIRNCNIHDINTNSTNPDNDSDAGANAILLMGEDVTPISDVMILNNNCFNNKTGWSECLSITANCQYVYVIANNVFNNTNIGIDFYGNNSDGYCPIPSLNQPRYCLCAGNDVSKSVSTYADCAAIYVDGARDILVQNNCVSESQYGIEVGSEEKNDDYPVRNILVRNNLFKNNTVTAIRVGGYEIETTGIVYSTKILNNTLINNACEFVIAKCDSLSIINNAATDNRIIKEFDDSYITNLTILNNSFGITFEKLYNESLIDSGIVDSYGKYDFFLKPRLNGVVDIGAIEFEDASQNI